MFRHGLPRCIAGVALLIATILRIHSLQAYEPETPAEQTVSAILAGEKAPAGGQPWMVALLRKSSTSQSEPDPICGGAVIASRWVLTAAHCVYGMKPRELEVLVGRDDLSQQGGHFIDVTEIAASPEYHPDYLYGDIAMLRLASPAYARPLLIPDAAVDASLQGELLQSYGWGVTRRNEATPCQLTTSSPGTDISEFRCFTQLIRQFEYPLNLQVTSLTLYSYEQCDKRYKEILASHGREVPDLAIINEYWSYDQLCAWDETKHSQPCYGDSGSPLTATVDNKTYVIGITSFGFPGGCVPDDSVHVYARVSFFAGFIEFTMNRFQSWGFDDLCPYKPEPEVSYSPRDDGRQDVKVRWKLDYRSMGYRLFYSMRNGADKSIRQIDLGWQTGEMTVPLPSGTRVFFTMQSRTQSCDGPMSDMIKVVVP